MAIKKGQKIKRPNPLPAVKLKTGRKTVYQPEFDEIAYRFCLINPATEEDLAEFFGVSTQALKRWDKEHPSFRSARMRGKASVDDEVAAALVHRALGYSHKAVKIIPNGVGQPALREEYIEHYPPDVTAANLWLANRRPDRWRLRPGDPGLGAEDAASAGPAVRIVGGLPEDEGE